MASLSALIRIIETIAPPSLAEAWDNVGLQLGDPAAEVTSIWVALDPSPEVIEAACRSGIDLLITHHPLFFRALQKIDLRTPVGKIVERALRNGLAIFAVHTNLDAATAGLNDILARRLGLKRITALVKSDGQTPIVHGIGRVGALPRTLSLKALALDVKKKLGVEAVRITGNPALRVRRVALCTGSGGSMMPHFLASGAEAFVTGDVRYHEAREIEAEGLGLIDAGHFHSERLIKDEWVRTLKTAFTRRRVAVRVEACPLEKDPFSTV
jgi:dinuclear metal center YbgI/SA1388 family protein